MRAFLLSAALLACSVGTAAAAAGTPGHPGVLQYSFAGKGSVAAIEQLWRRVLTAAAKDNPLSAYEIAAVEAAVSAFEFRLVKGCGRTDRAPVSFPTSGGHHNHREVNFN